jgi:hypothetical protein
LRIPGEGRGAAAPQTGCTAPSAASACRRGIRQAAKNHPDPLSSAASPVCLTMPERLGGAARSPIAHISLGWSVLRC